MIEVAELIQGSEQPLTEGVTGAQRCTLRIKGKAVSAVIKKLPHDKVCAEAFAALLLRGWGVSVPQPYLVALPEGLAFASAFESYPSLAQRLSLPTTIDTKIAEALAVIGCTLATSLPGAPLAAAADDAIGNFDRNLGNILWDGSSTFWIDHENAFSLVTNNGSNKLCDMARIADNATDFRQSVVAYALTLNRSTPADVASGIQAHLDADELAVFTAERLTRLGAILLSRFPQPDDLLAGL